MGEEKRTWQDALVRLLDGLAQIAEEGATYVREEREAAAEDRARRADRVMR